MLRRAKATQASKPSPKKKVFRDSTSPAVSNVAIPFDRISFTRFIRIVLPFMSIKFAFLAALQSLTACSITAALKYNAASSFTFVIFDCLILSYVFSIQLLLIDLHYSHTENHQHNDYRVPLSHLNDPDILSSSPLARL